MTYCPHKLTLSNCRVAYTKCKPPNVIIQVIYSERDLSRWTEHLESLGTRFSNTLKLEVSQFCLCLFLLVHKWKLGKIHVFLTVVMYLLQQQGGQGQIIDLKRGLWRPSCLQVKMWNKQFQYIKISTCTSVEGPGV